MHLIISQKLYLRAKKERKDILYKNQKATKGNNEKYFVTHPVTLWDRHKKKTWHTVFITMAPLLGIRQISSDILRDERVYKGRELLAC